MLSTRNQSEVERRRGCSRELEPGLKSGGDGEGLEIDRVPKEHPVPTEGGTAPRRKREESVGARCSSLRATKQMGSEGAEPFSPRQYSGRTELTSLQGGQGQEKKVRGAREYCGEQKKTKEKSTEEHGIAIEY